MRLESHGGAQSLTLSSPLTPTAISIMQFGLMTLMREYSPTLQLIDDVRLILDEIVLSGVSKPARQIQLDTVVGPEGIEVAVELSPAVDSLNGPVLAQLVDELTVVQEGDSSRVALRHSWPVRDGRQ